MINIGIIGDRPVYRQGWAVGTGDYAESEYNGTELYVRSLFAQLRAVPGVIDAEFSNKGALWMLRVRFSTGKPGSTPEDPLDGVRMSINRVQKSIFEPPLPAGMTNDEIRIIKRALQTNELDIFDEQELSDDGFDLYNLAVAGVEHRVVYQPLLSRTRTALLGFNWEDRTGNVGKNHTHAQLIIDADLGGILNFVLPETGAPSVWEGMIFQSGWVKHEPYYETAAGGRSVEYLEYEYGVWPLLLYPLAT